MKLLWRRLKWRLMRSNTNCFAIAWTCSSGRHLSSSRISNSSPCKRESHLSSICIFHSPHLSFKWLVSKRPITLYARNMFASYGSWGSWITWANSVTTQNSWGLSKESSIPIIFSCFNFLSICKSETSYTSQFRISILYWSHFIF